MKILHVIDTISLKVGGGPARVVYALAKEQAKLGHEVTIYSSDYEAEGQKPPEGAKLVTFKTAFRFKRLAFPGNLYFANFKGFDVMHLHNYRTLVNMMAADCFRGPIVLSAYGNILPVWHDGFWKRAILNKCSSLIACTGLEAAEYSRLGAKPERVKVIPLGVDLDEFKDVAPRKNGQKSILYLGKFHSVKGLDILLEAFSHLNGRNVRLKVVGWDDGFEALYWKRAHDIGIFDKVDWLGPLEGEAKARAFAEADIYVMPSRYEAFGLGVLEAAACGTPVIVTDKCAIAGQIPREVGSVTSLEPREMAHAIGTMLDSNYSCFYRAQRQKWAAGYSWENVAKKIEEVYRDAVASR